MVSWARPGATIVLCSLLGILVVPAPAFGQRVPDTVSAATPESTNHWSLGGFHVVLSLQVYRVQE